MRLRLVFAVACVGLGLLACSASTSPGGGDGTEPAVSQTVGASGGSVTAQGVELTIPAGALPGDTQITITPTNLPIPSGYTGLSQLYTFGPDGTVFQKPVTVSFTLTSTGSTPTVYWSNASGGFDPVATTTTSNGVSASVTHFSQGFVAEQREKPSVDAGADSSPPTDSGPIDDAGADAVSDSSTSDAATDGDGDAGSDAGSDAGTDAISDAAADAAAAGIVANLDNGSVATTFDTNASVVVSQAQVTVKADDNATTTHWTLQLVTTGVPQEQCLLNTIDPSITYTHYTGGQIDMAYSTKASTGQCTIFFSKVPAQPGQHATGTFQGTLGQTQGATGTPLTHTFANASFDLIY
jgi:hypothetical protein